MEGDPVGLTDGLCGVYPWKPPRVDFSALNPLSGAMLHDVGKLLTPLARLAAATRSASAPGARGSSTGIPGESLSAPARHSATA